MRFLVDAQLPPALARRLAAAGHVAEHVFDLGLAAAVDADIWRHAEQAGAVILTKDEDFAVRRTMRDAGPRVVWIRLGNTRRAELLRRVDDAFPSILSALERGDTLIEIT
jgi:predicted nuclease of predicted toxin-antitoxin system